MSTESSVYWEIKQWMCTVSYCHQQMFKTNFKVKLSYLPEGLSPRRPEQWTCRAESYHQWTANFKTIFWVKQSCWSVEVSLEWWNKAKTIQKLLQPSYRSEKMLNYMNKHVYLPKVAPLKHGCKGVRVVWVLGVCGEVIWKWKVMGRYPPHGIYLLTFK